MMKSNMTRMTHQRRIILDELRRSRIHPTADALYEAVRRNLPRISLATVYRNLECMSRTGMITKIDFGPQMRFDSNPEYHHHIFCLSCGRIDDVPPEAVIRLEFDPDAVKGYHMVGHSLHFFGVCNACTEHQPSQKHTGEVMATPVESSLNSRKKDID